MTRADGRTLYEVDGRPAAEVYNEWTRGKLDTELETGGNVLAKTTLSPLGIARNVGAAEMFLLAHPERVDRGDHSLSLFTEVRKGEKVVLMRSSPAALKQRGANVARRAIDWGRLDTEQLVGAYFIYCGGCLLAIENDAASMVSQPVH